MGMPEGITIRHHPLFISIADENPRLALRLGQLDLLPGTIGVTTMPTGDASLMVE